MYYRRWNPETIIDYILDLHAKDEPLNSRYVKLNHPQLHRAAFTKMGNWENAVTAAGFDYKKIKRYKNWTKEDIIKGIRQAWQAGEDLSWHWFSNHPDYSRLAAAAVKSRYFGSWRAALRAAGLSETSIERYQKWNKQRVINCIRDYNRRGVPLDTRSMRNRDSKLYYAACSRFGCWSAAVEAAGINYVRHALRRRKSREEILHFFASCWKQGLSLSSPSAETCSQAHYTAAEREFGSWHEARKAILQYIKQKTAIDEEES